MALGVGAVAGAVMCSPGVMEPHAPPTAQAEPCTRQTLLDCWHRGGGGEALYAKRRQRDDIGKTLTRM